MGDLIQFPRRPIATGKRIGGETAEITYLHSDGLPRVEDAEPIVAAVFYGIQRALRRVYDDDGARPGSMSGEQQ